MEKHTAAPGTGTAITLLMQSGMSELDALRFINNSQREAAGLITDIPHEKNMFAINQAASLADIGTLISETLNYFDEEGKTDTTRDRILEIHSMIYPNSTQPESSGQARIRITGEVVHTLNQAIEELTKREYPNIRRALDLVTSAHGLIVGELI